MGSSFPLRESFSRGELVTTVILGSACFPLGFVDSRNSLLNQRPYEGNGNATQRKWDMPIVRCHTLLVKTERCFYEQFT